MITNMNTKTPRELLAECAEQLSTDGHYELAHEIAALKAAQPVDPTATNLSDAAIRALWMSAEPTDTTKTPLDLLAECGKQLSADVRYELAHEIAALKAAQPEPAAPKAAA